MLHVNEKYFNSHNQTIRNFILFNPILHGVFLHPILHGWGHICPLVSHERQNI